MSSKGGIKRNHVYKKEEKKKEKPKKRERELSFVLTPKNVGGFSASKAALWYIYWFSTKWTTS